MSDTEGYLRSVKRRRRRGPAPEPEQTKPLRPLVAQGARGHAPPQAPPSIDQLIRDAARNRATIWRPIG